MGIQKVINDTTSIEVNIHKGVEMTPVVTATAVADTIRFGTNIIFTAGIIRVVNTTSNISANFRVANQATEALIDGPAGFTATENNPATVNVYWLTDQFVVQNNSGGPIDFEVFQIGT